MYLDFFSFASSFPRSSVCSTIQSVQDPPLITNTFQLVSSLKNGITHAFVVEFASVEDRDYYVKEDPAHREFVKGLDGILEKAQVVDFTDRVY